MAIQKKSLIGNRAAAKKAIVAKSATTDVTTVQTDMAPKALRKPHAQKFTHAPNALRKVHALRIPAALRIATALKKPATLKK